MDLAKRNALIDSYLAISESAEPTNKLTEQDRAAIAAARAEEPNLPPERRVVVTIPPDEEEDIVVELDQLVTWKDQLLGPGGRLDIGPLTSLGDVEKYAGLSVADVFEKLITRQRNWPPATVPTIDIRAFYDGNTDRGSLAPNIVDGEGGPTFETLRDTLLGLAARDDVAAVGVEVHELPNPEVDDDNDMWIHGERVFLWTTQRAPAVKKALAAIRPTAVSRERIAAVTPPASAATPLPKGTFLYAIVWD
jgi:hypothetical protein